MPPVKELLSRPAAQKPTAAASPRRKSADSTPISAISAIFRRGSGETVLSQSKSSDRSPMFHVEHPRERKKGHDHRTGNVFAGGSGAEFFPRRQKGLRHAAVPERPHPAARRAARRETFPSPSPARADARRPDALGLPEPNRSAGREHGARDGRRQRGHARHRPPRHSPYARAHLHSPDHARIPAPFSPRRREDHASRHPRPAEDDGRGQARPVRRRRRRTQPAVPVRADREESLYLVVPEPQLRRIFPDHDGSAAAGRRGAPPRAGGPTWRRSPTFPSFRATT